MQLAKRRKQYYEDHSPKKFKKSDYRKEYNSLLQYSRDILIALNSRVTVPLHTPWGKIKPCI